MSQQNVELVRQRFEAFNRGDLAAMVDLTDPAAVWWDRSDDPWGGAPHRGRDACMRHLAEILEDAELEAQPQELIDAGNSVVVGVRLVGRGRSSGVAFEEHEFHVFKLRDGKVIETREYRERDEALEAAGLSGTDATSRNNLGVMRSWAEAWNRTDLASFADLYDADAVVITDPAWMEAGPFLGRAAIMDWYEGLKESWQQRDAVVVKELFEANDKVVARLDWQVRGRASGIELELDATGVHTIENGKIVRQQWYFDHAMALEAVGLSG